MFAAQKRGNSQQAPGRLPSGAVSTISPRLARGRQKDGSYCLRTGWHVRDLGWTRCRHPHKLKTGSAIYRFLPDHLLYRRWPSSQIAHRLRLMNPDDPSARVCHDTIYAAIEARPCSGLKTAMFEAVRQAKSTSGSARTPPAGTSIASKDLSVVHRPAEIKARREPSQWEVELIKRALNRASVGTLPERKTRIVVLFKKNSTSAQAVLDSFICQLHRLAVALRKSMTDDHGCEMGCHPAIARRLKVDLWFCYPLAPSRRGSNEKTHGRQRQFMPKGTDLGDVSQRWFNDVAPLMNNRPRKTRGRRTPARARAQDITAFK